MRIILLIAFSGLAFVGLASANRELGEGPLGRSPPCCTTLPPLQTKTSGCLLGRAPDLACSPGEIVAVSFSDLGCAGPNSLPIGRYWKRQVGVAYGLPASTEYGPKHEWEIVAVVPGILGGVSIGLNNQYPIPSSDLTSRAKLVRALADRVWCKHTMTLAHAQYAIRDWPRAYRQIFHKSA